MGDSPDLLGEAAERRRILVLGCSERKQAAPGLLPAVERYDSPTFRLVRKYLDGERGTAIPTIVVVSAAHGLIRGDCHIAPYDRQMTPARANELRPSVLARFAALPGANMPADVLFCGSLAYRAALAGLQACLSPGSSVRSAPPRPGERLAYLHDWLYGHAPAVSSQPAVTTTSPVSVRVRGVQATLTADGLLALGRQTLASGNRSQGQPSTWAIDLDGTPVSPKWLVGAGLGLPSSAFGTSDALRVLGTLGIPVRRTAW